MKLMVLILNKTDVLDSLLEGLSAAGIGGATIIESSGLATTLSRLDSSFISSSIRAILSGSEDDNRTIMSVIRNDQLEIARNLSLGMDNIHYEKLAAEEMNFPDKSFDAITACQCFWYFDPNVVVPKIKSLLKDGGIFVKVYISYLKEEPVTQDSNALVKKINPNWHGAASALEDLRRHYFENPQMETFITEIPFTRESWHGRMLASRGVMASMNENQLRQFDQEHRAMLEEKYPEKFSIKHKIFLTWYKL